MPASAAGTGLRLARPKPPVLGTAGGAAEEREGEPKALGVAEEEGPIVDGTLRRTGDAGETTLRGLEGGEVCGNDAAGV